MRVGIITFELFENRKKDSVGSSRLRGSWIVKNWPEAEIYKIGREYDVLIFQKAYFLRMMENFKGIKILDMCDPDWLDKRPVKQSIELCDAVTCSSEGLTEFISGITDKPVRWVPDRLDLQYFTDKKVHSGKAKQVSWFGYHNNFQMVDTALITIKRLGLQLNVFSDIAYYPTTAVAGIGEDWILENVRNRQYNQQSINSDLVSLSDIIINPKSEEGKYKFKSTNKTLIGWALGLPVAHDSEELERFMDEAKRKKEAELRLAEVKNMWDISLSVNQYKSIIDDINGKRTPKSN